MDLDPLVNNLKNLGAGARNLANAAVGAQNVNKALSGAAKAGGALKIVFADLLSPLGIAAGLALGFATGIYKAVMNSQLLQSALERASQVQLYTPQFKALLGTLDKAKQRLNEIAKISAAGPFKFDDLVEAEKKLINLTNGRLANPQGRQMTQDLAAVTQMAPSEAADILGNLEADIALERPIEGAVRQLRALGGISEDAKNQLISLERAGVRGAGLWSALSGALERNRGGAEALRNTLAGLSQELDNVKGQQLGEIGAMFEEAKMEGLRLAIELVREWGPVLKELLLPIAMVANFLAKMTREIMTLVRSIPGLKEGFLLVARAAGLVLVAFAAIGALQLGRVFLFLVPLLGKLALGLGRAALAGGMFSKVLSFGMVGILRLLGPIGLLIGALVALSQSSIFKSLFPGLDEDRQRLEDLKRQIEEAASGGSGAGSGGGIGGAGDDGSVGGVQAQVNKLKQFEEAREQARQEMAAAKKAREEATKAREASQAQGSNPNDAGAIAAAGGRFGELNNAVRWLLGFDPSAVAEEAAIERERAAKELLQKSEEGVAAARGAAIKAPADFLNDPDFARAKAEAEGLLAKANAAQDALDRQGGAAANPAEAQRIEAMRGEAVARMDPQRIEQDFNRRMARESVQARLTRTMAEVTGDEGLRQRANTLEDENRTQVRGKELAKDLGIPITEALDLARGEVLSDRLSSEQSRGENMMFASGLARVGGAAGESGGGSSEEARLLQQIARILERSSPADLPAEMTAEQR
jgi:hypothetical protein